MQNYFRKFVLTSSFESFHKELVTALERQGMVSVLTADFQKAFLRDGQVHTGKYEVLSVYDPKLYTEMVAIAPVRGIVLPCTISIIELYPGKIAVIPVNQTEIISRDMKSEHLRFLAGQVTVKINLVLETMEKEEHGLTSMVTSWS